MKTSKEKVTGMYIQSVSMKDFRCFHNASASFVYPTDSNVSKMEYPNVNLILGTNASGKSAVLKALALSVLAPALQSSGYVPAYIVRRPSRRETKAPTRGTVTSSLLLFAENSSIETQMVTDGQVILQRKGDRDIVLSTAIVNDSLWLGIFEDNDPGFFLVAYGATRRVELGEVDLQLRDRSRAPRYQRVAGLFEDYVGLIPPSTWIKHLDSQGRLDDAVSLLCSVLPEEVIPKIDRSSGTATVVYDAAGTELPFTALADGYRAFIGWVGDLLFNLGLIASVGQKLTDIRGVVIVDEVDLHLHPEWQRDVVDRISKSFPRIQFFFTTHSPLVTSSLEAKNIWLCEIGETGKRELNRARVTPFGLSPDQILSSAYFGLTSVRPVTTETRLRELTRKAADGDTDAAIEFLRVLSGSKKATEGTS